MQLLGLNTAELEAALRAMGEPAYRGRQIAEWLYQKGATSFDAMTNLPRALREKLATAHEITYPAVATRHQSRDGSEKLLLNMGDSERIETVRLPYPDRLSVCVSSQAGCAMACVFCATGIGGFRRNLSVAEIIAQPLLAAGAGGWGLGTGNGTPPSAGAGGWGLGAGNDTPPSAGAGGWGLGTGNGTSTSNAQHPTPRTQHPEPNTQHPTPNTQHPTHIVFMGMGEPLLNLGNVLPAVHLMHDEMGIPMRNITVSTVGILPGIAKLAEAKLQLTLAISLHAPSDDLRHRLIPTSRKTRVEEIIAAARHYVKTTGRRVTFEYVMLGGVNDGRREAQRLARLCAGWPCHVNLIPWNPVPGATFEGEAFDAPPAENVRQFRATLEKAGVATTQRVQRGADIAGACGQLRAESL